MSDRQPYGAWRSPITAAELAAGAVTLSDLRVVAGRLYWLESRPAEGGRLVVMTSDNDVRLLTPEGFNVRTRVHEYGGAPFVVCPDGLWFSNFKDQQLYRQRGETPPEAMTPTGYRYADATPAPGGSLIAVREDHTDPGAVRNTIVRLSGQSGDAGDVLFDTSDFVAYPRVSPCGRRLAWIAWDFPAMPWDATRLYTAELTAAGLCDVRVLAGGAYISVIDPQWTETGTLTWLSDESGFWTLYQEADGGARSLLPRQADFGGPLWTLGRAHYALVGDQILATSRDPEGETLWSISPSTGVTTTLPTPYSALTFIQALGKTHIAAIGHSAQEASVLVTIDILTGAREVVRRTSPTKPRTGDVAIAQPIHFPSAEGRITHALYYPPTSSAFHAPPDEKPPLIVQAHGGPTGAASAAFNPSIQYWTSRGFAIVDVDYGGSTGYGRAYRERLRGLWGVVDVEDVIAAAQHLITIGWIDPQRIAIRGASAGGFTVLAALSQSDVFSAGGDFYGVADLVALSRDTHKFESRYMDGLIGPWPEAKEIYAARSPINHLERFIAPLLILHGAEDPVVPLNQAHMIRDALKGRGVPVAFIEFEDEGHGFRRAENIVRAKEAELDFYGEVFGFAPADKN